MSGAVMAEIDLIPADYRTRRAVERAFRTLGLLVLGVTCVCAAAAAALNRSASAARAELRALEAEAVVLEARRDTIAQLRAAKAALENEAAVLDGLRRDAALGNWLAAVANAAPDGVWFDSWRAERLGVPVHTVPAGGEAYFVAENGAPPLGAAHVRLAMTIAGEARDHAVVTAFVAQLGALPGVREVRLERASRGTDERVVGFELTLIAESGGAGA